MKSGLASGPCPFSFCIAMQTETGIPLRTPAVTTPTGCRNAFSGGMRGGLIPTPSFPRGDSGTLTMRGTTFSVQGERDAISSVASQWRSSGRTTSAEGFWRSPCTVNTGTVFVGSATAASGTTTGGDGAAPGRVETGYPTLSVSAIAIDQSHPDTIYSGPARSAAMSVRLSARSAPVRRTAWASSGRPTGEPRGTPPDSAGHSRTSPPSRRSSSTR